MCDARSTVRERVEFWRPLAEDQGRTMEISLPASQLVVRLASQDLTDLLDVLVDNVFAHTQEGVDLRVALGTDLDTAVLTVSDDGPGQRLDAATAGFGRPGSTGLGLDIARRIAQGCGGSLTIGTGPGGGVLVDVRLPLATR